MFNAYPDSIGNRLADAIRLLKLPELEDAFSLFYILPTFFHSDLDRGFSIIDYDINEALVSTEDIAALDELGIQIKLDLVLNHLSVRSPQFQDLLCNGEASRYRDFFIDWDEFWKDHGTRDAEGQVVPDKVFLDRLFMRKPSLPILKVRFPDGSLKTYWNTFYQKVDFAEITALDFADIEGLDADAAQILADQIKIVIKDKGYLEAVDLDHVAHLKDDIIKAVCSKREYLGQMDLNARSELVWSFYDETLKKLSGYGAKIIRLDAFAYLHKAPGEPNFFNRPGTWIYLQRLKSMAQRYALTIFPEIHAEYGAGIHQEIAEQGFPVYDFYFPGLLIHALEFGDSHALLRWIGEIRKKGLQTINMLGCHDGIPVLDLRGKHTDGIYRPGLLSDEQIEATMQRIIDRGGLTKNLYDASGKKIDYYQVNATFFSALGEDEDKLLLARAIQMFMPGVPQVWYLDLFAGKNDYEAAKQGRTAGHKEINRTTLHWPDIEAGLRRRVVRDQLALIRLRNTSPAFSGELRVIESDPHQVRLAWVHPEVSVRLEADLCDHSFAVYQDDGTGEALVLASPGHGTGLSVAVGEAERT
ncbi:MAG: glycosidase [Gammaproteobacteria bacterium]|nr:glycosidase [Gammaproteobacteria bacterium]